MSTNSTANRRPLVFLILAFALPILAAKIILSMNWYQGGATNSGELLSNNINYRILGMENPIPQQWQLAYLLPKSCGEECQTRLYILQQSHIALGKNRSKLTPIILVQKDSDISALNKFTFTTFPANASLTAQLKQSLMVIDPLGTLVMSYPLVKGKDAHVSQGKAMVKDIRKMLKLSRLG